MNYNPQTLRQLQSALVGVLEAIDAVCRKNGITYWLDSGTALGARRHAGFIPWDDDIDLGMMRADYERFLEVAPSALGESYVVSNPRTNGHQATLFTKVWKRGTAFQTRETQDARFDQGIFVDVFPYDSVCAAPVAAKKQKEACTRWQRVSYLYHSAHVHVPHDGALGKAEQVAAAVAHRYLRMRYTHEGICARFEAAATVGQQDPSGKVFCGAYAYMGEYDRSVFLPPSELPFEGRMFSCPAKIDAYLKVTFGNWQQLPPPEKRVNHAPDVLEF